MPLTLLPLGQYSYILNATRLSVMLSFDFKSFYYYLLYSAFSIFNVLTMENLSIIFLDFFLIGYHYFKLLIYIMFLLSGSYAFFFIALSGHGHSCKLYACMDSCPNCFLTSIHGGFTCLPISYHVSSYCGF